MFALFRRDRDIRGKPSAFDRQQAVIEFSMDEVHGKHQSLLVESAYRASDDYRQF